RREQQGLEPLASDQAQTLALQSLRYLYRILFLLYAEASPEVGVLPVGAPEYQAGYSVDRLRDLTQREVPLEAADGTHLYTSLDLLLRLVHERHNAGAAPAAAAVPRPPSHSPAPRRAPGCAPLPSAPLHPARRCGPGPRGPAAGGRAPPALTREEGRGRGLPQLRGTRHPPPRRRL